MHAKVATKFLNTMHLLGIRGSRDIKREERGNAADRGSAWSEEGRGIE